MTPVRMLGIVLVVAGVIGLALAFGDFSYTKESEKAAIGPLKLTVQQKERVTVPPWVGGLALLAGVALIVVGKKK